MAGDEQQRQELSRDCDDVGGYQKRSAGLSNVKGEETQDDCAHAQLEMCKTDSYFV